MKIAVTGSSGSVGGAIVKMALEHGHQVVCIDRVKPPSDSETAKKPLIQAELSDYDATLSAFKGCYAVIHMAAIPAPGGHPDHVVHNNNVTSSYNVLRAAVEL